MGRFILPTRRASCRWATALGVALCVLLLGVAAMAAEDVKALAAQVSDQAFALLTSISSSHEHTNTLLGPVGVFAADSQKLSSAVQSGDRAGAAAAMAALKADADAVDKAGASGGLDSGKWAAIKHDLNALSASVPNAPAGAVAASVAPAEAGPSPATALPTETHSGPTVRIESAQMAGADVLRIKGYMSGRGIRSAGIYLGRNRLGKLDVKQTPGDQTIRFDLQIRNPAQGSVLRVYDSAGRIAQAPLPVAGPIVERSAPVAPLPAPSLGSDENVALGGGDDFSSDMKAMVNPPAADVPDTSPPEGASEDNTKEIPAATPPPSGPRSRMRSHLRGHGPNDIRVRIDSLAAVNPGTRDYLVKGQISGSNLKRAGIYIDGRLAQQIPISSGIGSHSSDFAQSFTATGTEATIRVYRTRRDYTETSLDLASATSGSGLTAPAAINSTIGGAYGGYAGLNSGQLAVQITSVQAAAASLYVVSGIITGHNIASAGIYQNGMLAQPLNISSGGIGGLISGLIPGMSRQVSFTGRFNPAQGFATVRAYDSGGMMAEQPIMAGGTGYGMNPYGYGGMNSYGGINPYGAINPYGGMNPYATNPYGAPPGYGVGVAPGVGVSPRTSAGGGLGSVPW